MVVKKFSVILPVIFLTAVIIAGGCAKRVSTSQLDEGGAERSETPSEISKSEPRSGEDIVAIAEPSLPRAEVYEDTIPGEPAKESSISSAIFKDIKDIFFDFDKYTIRDDSRAVLQTNASIIKNKKAKKVVIEGHCDERGTNEYNLALGERRAQSTKRYLAALGVNPSTISTISYGEEKPFCSNQNEECWQQNRRAHFVVE
ncbi:MAG: peptidoglycan-associated lipoprotein Pal [candidate division WOR-3 bacterium]